MSSDPPDMPLPGRRRSIHLQRLLNINCIGNEQLAAESNCTPDVAETDTILRDASSYWYSYTPSDNGISPESPIDLTALQAALPPGINYPLADSPRLPTNSEDQFTTDSAYMEATNPYFTESDRIPLTARAQLIAGSLAVDDHDSDDRDSFQTVSDPDNDSTRNHEIDVLGRSTDSGHALTLHRSFGISLTPHEHRISSSQSSSGAFHRAGSIVRAMSQRVVNISGDSEMVDERASRDRPHSPRNSGVYPSRQTVVSIQADTSYVSPLRSEKSEGPLYRVAEPHSQRLTKSPKPCSNPLKGYALGIFPPESPTRRWMCDIMVNPYTEPLILLLIVLQAILLAVESGPDVFSKGNGRPERWGRRSIDWAMLGLFIVFTMELFARIIVSGFILNAEEYSSIDRKKGVRAAITEQYRTIFQPERHKSVKGTSNTEPQPSAFSRSFTTIMQGQQALPASLEEQQRLQLARRAFLRHSFNRLDFVAVVSFWVAFILGITGLENRHHLYLFKMLSCLRILRLLALTHGTAVREI